LSLFVGGAPRQIITPPAEISASGLVEVIDYVSRASKEGRSKDEILSNVFVMLDRECEQSIVRGMEDLKGGRLRRVPQGENPVKFLKELASKM